MVDINNTSPVNFTGGTNTVTSGNGISNGTVNFQGGTTTFDSGSTYSVATTNINGGDVNFDNTGDTNTLVHVSNILGGSGSLTVNNTWTPTSGVTVNGNLVLDSGSFSGLSGTSIVIVNGSGSLVNRGTLQLQKDTINLDIDNDGGLLWIQDSGNTDSFLGGAFQNRNGATLQLIGANNNGEAYLFLTGGGTFTNDATSSIDLVGGFGTNSEALLDIGAGTLVNDGTITSSFGALGQSNVLVGSITNNGVIDVNTTALEIDNDDTIFDTSMGELDLTAGVGLNVRGGASGGTTVIGGGTTFTNTDGLFDVTTFGGVGQTQILQLASDVTIPAGIEPVMLGGTAEITVNGPGNFINNGTLVLQKDTLNVSVDNDGGFLQVFGSGNTDSTITGTFQNRNGATLELLGGTNNEEAHLFLTGGSFTNDVTSTIALTGGFGSGSDALLNLAPGTLTNDGLITSNTTFAQTNFVDAPIINAGDILIQTAALQIENSGRTFAQNSGSIDLGMDLTFNGGGNFNWAGGALQNTGSILGGPTVNVTGGGTRLLDGPTISSSNVTIAGGSLELRSGTFSASGTTAINSGATLQLTGATFSPTGAVNNDGTIDLDVGNLSLANGGTHTGDFDVALGSVLQFTGGTHAFNSGSDTTGTGDVAFTGTADASFNTGSTYNISGDTGVSGGSGNVAFNINAVTNSFTHDAGQYGTGSTGSLTTMDWLPAPSAQLDDIQLILDTGSSNSINLGAPITLFGTASIENRGTLDLANIPFIYAGTGSFLNTGNLTLDFVSFNTLPLTNQGSIIIGGGNLTDTNGPLNMQGGSIEVQSGTLNATGTTTVSVNSSILETGGTFNLGTLNVNSGSTLSITNGQINAGATTISGGSTIDASGLDFLPTSLTFNSGTLTGSSDVIISGLTTWNDGSMIGGGTTFANGGIDFAGSATRVIDRDVEHTGTRAWTPSGSITGSGTFTHQAGTLSMDSRFFLDPDFVNNGTVNIDLTAEPVSQRLIGFGNVQNNGTLQVDVGTFRIDGTGTNTTGIFRLEVGAELLFRNAYDFNGGSITNVSTGFGDVTLDGGFLDVTGGTIGVNTLQLGSGSALDADGGVVTVASNTAIDASSVLTVSTAGSLIHNGNLNNGGRLELDAGDLDLPNGGTHNSGTFDVVSGSTLDFTGGLHQFLGTVNLQGNGTYEINGGTINVSSVLNLLSGATLKLSGDAIGGAGTINSDSTIIAEGSSAFLGNLNSNSPLIVQATSASGDASLAVTNLFTDGQVTLSNTDSGTARNASIIAAASYINNGNLDIFDLNGGGIMTVESQLLINSTGASIDAQSGNVVFDGGAGTGFLSNSGSIFVNGPSVLVQDFNQVNNDGLLNVSNSSTFTQTGAGTLFTNNNLFIDDNGAVIVPDFEQIGGTVNLNGSSAFLASTNQIRLTGGTFGGTGQVSVSVMDFNQTGGILQPGGSPGTLSINGNYVMGPGATLVAELGGLNQGVNYDLLSVTGDATLNGTLDVQLFGGFAGNVGDQFDIISANNINSDFATVTVPASYSISTATNTPATGIYQLEMTAVPGATTPPPMIPPAPTPTPTPTVDEDLIDIGTDQVIVLNEYQNDAVPRFAEPDDDDDDDKKKELVCR